MNLRVDEYNPKIKPKQIEIIDDNEDIPQFFYYYHIFLNCIVFIVVLS